MKRKPWLNMIAPYYDTQGEKRWADTSKWPVFDKDSKEVEGVFGISRDVTESVRAKEALQENDERMRTIIETSMDAVVQINSAGDITGWNSQAEKIFGWTKLEAVGRAMHETIIPIRYRETHLRGIKHFLLTGEGPVLNTRLELTGLHRDGHEFPVELAVTPIRMGPI